MFVFIPLFVLARFYQKQRADPNATWKLPDNFAVQFTNVQVRTTAAFHLTVTDLNWARNGLTCVLYFSALYCA